MNKSPICGYSGYQKVIGTRDVYVKLGSLDEKLYWRVINRTQGNVGSTKQFYISPVISPGYTNFIKNPKWQEKIKLWSIERNKYLKFLREKKTQETKLQI